MDIFNFIFYALLKNEKFHFSQITEWMAPFLKSFIQLLL